MWVWCVCILASLGAFLFGLDIGYIAPILECASFKRDVAHMPNWNDPKSSIPAGQLGFMVATFSIGCIIASFPPISSFFLDVWGRRDSIILGSTLFICGTLAQLGTHSILSFALGRFVAGCAVGLLSSVVALYQSEIAPAAIRGGLTSLYQLMIVLGILVATLVDVPLVVQDGGWRWAIAFQLLPAFILLAGMCQLPRSPRWLVQRGRHEEALEVLLALRANEVEAREELAEIIESYEASLTWGEPQWSEMLRGRLARLLLVGMAVQALQQLVGMSAIMYYGPKLFRDLGHDPNVFQLTINIVNLCATVPSLYLVDRCGRKTLLLWGSAGCAIACGVVGSLGLYMTKGAGEIVAVQPAIVAMVFFFVVNAAYGWGPVPWVYCAEIYPLKYRARCNGVTTMSNWIGNFFIGQFTPVLFESFGWGTFYVFGTNCLVALCMSLWLPETRGLPLEHIDALFDAKLGTTETSTSEMSAVAGVKSTFRRKTAGSASTPD